MQVLISLKLYLSGRKEYVAYNETVFYRYNINFCQQGMQAGIFNCIG